MVIWVRLDMLIVEITWGPSSDRWRVKMTRMPLRGFFCELIKMLWFIFCVGRGNDCSALS
ncbi:hypothetical protein Hanom_Chr14g01277721 [Helianthus anomalus]